MDRGLSVSWYDLAESNREQYLKWLHGTYIPKLLGHPGVLYATHYKAEESIKPLDRLRHTTDPSVPAGNGYIFIVGATSPHVLADLTPYKAGAELSSEERTMLGMRAGERRNLFAEEERALGPDTRRREGGVMLAPCIQLGSFNAGTWQDEDELLSWYAHFRLPSLNKMPGCIAIRKLVSVSGWAKHGVLYEFTSLEDRAKQFRAHEAADEKMAKWTEEVVVKLMHAPGSPNVAQRIWPPIARRSS
jgi:hypothetical protein